MKKSELEKILKGIQKRNGGVLRPENVVETARPPGSALHSFFTWDDSEAAEKWRLEEARTLIRTVTIVQVNSQKLFRTPVFVRDVTIPSGEQGYSDIRGITEMEAKMKTLSYELERAEGALNRAISIAEYFGIKDVLESIKEKLEEVRKLKLVANL